MKTNETLENSDLSQNEVNTSNELNIEWRRLNTMSSKRHKFCKFYILSFVIEHER